MARKQVPVRIDPQIYELIAWAASIDGVSISEFLAGAGTARAYFTLAREHPDHIAAWNRFFADIQSIQPLIDNANQRRDQTT